MAYRFWNGACFGLLYVLLLGTRRLWAVPVFGILLGIGFLLSPVVSSLGAGFLGVGFSVGFPITVTLAHAAFGAVLGWLRSFAHLAASTAGVVDPATQGRRRAERGLILPYCSLRFACQA